MPWLSISYSLTYLIAEQMLLAMVTHGTEQQGVPFDKSVFILFYFFLISKTSLIIPDSSVF